MASLHILLYILFVLSAIVLVVVILLQEGSGGGLGEALGGHGQATFGPGARGINRFTGWTAAVFLVCALGIHAMNSRQAETSVLDEAGGATVQPAPEGEGQ